MDITEKESMRMTNCDVHVYFSDLVIEEIWGNKEKFVQKGSDLGERMMEDAFKKSFDKGYKRVIGVRSDLPDLSSEIMTEGLEALKLSDTVFGPSEDGGYYLVGMTYLIPQIFKNKAWSTESLLDDTITELKGMNTLRREIFAWIYFRE